MKGHANRYPYKGYKKKILSAIFLYKNLVKLHSVHTGLVFSFEEWTGIAYIHFVDVGYACPPQKRIIYGARSIFCWKGDIFFISLKVQSTLIRKQSQTCFKPMNQCEMSFPFTLYFQTSRVETEKNGYK